MIRKLLVVAAAVAMPVTVIAVTGVTAGKDSGAARPSCDMQYQRHHHVCPSGHFEQWVGWYIEDVDYHDFG